MFTPPADLPPCLSGAAISFSPQTSHDLATLPSSTGTTDLTDSSNSRPDRVRGDATPRRRSDASHGRPRLCTIRDEAKEDAMRSALVDMSCSLDSLGTRTLPGGPTPLAPPEPRFRVVASVAVEPHLSLTPHAFVRSCRDQTPLESITSTLQTWSPFSGLEPRRGGSERTPATSPAPASPFTGAVGYASDISSDEGDSDVDSRRRRRKEENVSDPARRGNGSVGAEAIAWAKWDNLVLQGSTRCGSHPVLMGRYPAQATDSTLFNDVTDASS